MSNTDEPSRRASIGPNDLVSHALASSPMTVHVFMRHHMACPGCAMAPFVTVAEAAASYGLEPQRLVRELNAAITATRP